MAILAEQEILVFLKRSENASNGILVFGSDEAGISSMVRRITNLFAADEEPLRLDASSLRNDPTELIDAFKAMSLLGGRRLILVEGCEEIHLRFLEPVMAEKKAANFVVMKAVSLSKTSKLREAATAAPRFHAVALYEDTPLALLARVEKLARERGTAFADGAAERFIQLVGSSRGQIEGELEKLTLYAWPADVITEFDVEACCGEQASFEVDVLLTAMLDGELDDCDRIFASMLDDGSWRQALILLQLQMVRLENLRVEIANGVDMERAFRTAKPPVFFNLQKTVARQLRLFSVDDINQFGLALQSVVLSSRQQAGLAEAIVSRTLLSIARKAAQLRQRAKT